MSSTWTANEYNNKAQIKGRKANKKILTFLKVWNLKCQKKNALEYENKEQKEIKEKKSEGDDNDWGNETNCNSFARI